ncbi:MAG: carbonic anhydrase, partial [Ilumatobacteraceae bacterium]
SGGVMPEHHPQVAVLTCADARIGPMALFGLEPGEAFVVRVAGNSATADVVASLTFAVEALGVDLVVVLGHTGCGAVAAAMAATTDVSYSPILAPIDEVIEWCAAQHDLDQPAEPLATSTVLRANVARNVARLRRDRGPLGAAIAAGRVDVRGAVVDLISGELVEIDDTGHPIRPGSPI